MKEPLDVPSLADLRRVADELAVEEIHVLVRWEKPDLKRFAANREALIGALDLAPGKAQAWVRDGADAEALRIATHRQEVSDLYEEERAFLRPPFDQASAWDPITGLERAVLGDRNARALLFRAEELRGKAMRDPDLAARITEPGRRNIDSLRSQATTGLSEASAAIAAQHALRIRDLIDSAPEMARAAGFNPETSRLKGPPSKRYEDLLGTDILSVLSSCSSTIADHMTQLDDSTLTYLAKTTETSWENFDPNVAAQRARLTEDRDGALARALAATRRWGEEPDDFNEIIRDQTRSELLEIESELSAVPEIGNPGRLLSIDPVAAIVHDTSQTVLLERSAEQARQSRGQEPETGPDAGMDFF